MNHETVTSGRTFCSYVEVDTHETGKCMGGGYYMCNMYPLQSCNKHEARW